MADSPEPASQRILVIEDERLAREMLVRLLQESGYSVEAVGTVAEALALLDGQDFVILDLNLPDGNGTRVLRLIRREKRPIRVVLLTAAYGPLLDRALRLQPDLFLKKPIRVPELLSWLAEPR